MTTNCGVCEQRHKFGLLTIPGSTRPRFDSFIVTFLGFFQRGPFDGRRVLPKTEQPETGRRWTMKTYFVGIGGGIALLQEAIWLAGNIQGIARYFISLTVLMVPKSKDWQVSRPPEAKASIVRHGKHDCLSAKPRFTK
jgi:hypothetical protein